MSFGLSRGRELDVSGVLVDAGALPPLPDNPLENPHGGWIDPREWFPDPSRPFELEIGPGKGAFLVHEAESRPEVNFLGIEWAREFCVYAADRMRRRGLENVKMMSVDATDFLRWRTPSGIVRTLHLYFSDPWPKPRHHKRRVVQDAFLEQAHRVLEPGGELRVVTDHPEYWRWMEARFDRWCAPDHEPRFERRAFEDADRPAGAREGELTGTNFERKYREEGRDFFATVLRKA
jgi:tRNA (guanine-N7-)-methyltransferase